MEWKLFWRLWIQKIFRNIASMKFWILMLLYRLVEKGMYDGLWQMDKEGVYRWIAKIKSAEGLGFFSAGFASIVLGRIIIDKLSGNGNGSADDEYHGGITVDKPNVITTDCVEGEEDEVEEQKKEVKPEEKIDESRPPRIP